MRFGTVAVVIRDIACNLCRQAGVHTGLLLLLLRRCVTRLVLGAWRAVQVFSSRYISAIDSRCSVPPSLYMAST